MFDTQWYAKVYLVLHKFWIIANEKVTFSSWIREKDVHIQIYYFSLMVPWIIIRLMGRIFSGNTFFPTSLLFCFTLLWRADISPFIVDLKIFFSSTGSMLWSRAFDATHTRIWWFILHFFFLKYECRALLLCEMILFVWPLEWFRFFYVCVGFVKRRNRCSMSTTQHLCMDSIMNILCI